MKKTIILTLSILLANFSILMAQKGKELVFGLGGAITNPWIVNQSFYGEPEIDYAPKVGYAAFFTMGYNFTESLSIMTELQYSLQGQKYDGKQSFNSSKYDVQRNINLRYLNIPLFFKSSFGDKMTRFRFMAGPQIGILLEATQEYLRDGKVLGTHATDLNGKTFQTDASSIDDRFIKTDISLAFDVGADIHVSDQIFISGGFRGNYGFKDINAEAYRIKNIDGEYTPSHNLWSGIYVSLCYKIDVQGYSQRSF